MASKQRRIGIFVLDDVEVLDFAGPFEVFTVADRMQPMAPFKANMVSERPGPIKARGDFVVQPHVDFNGCKKKPPEGGLEKS